MREHSLSSRVGQWRYRNRAGHCRATALVLLFGVLLARSGGATGVEPVAGDRLDAGHLASESAVVFDVARGISIERLEGQAARAHLLNLMAKYPEQFSRAQVSLVERGAAPTEEVFVLRSLALAEPTAESSSSSGFTPESLAIGDANGEMIFWSWDDGDPSTWEGQIYVAHYSESYEGIFNAQFAIGSVPYAVTWENLVWYRWEPWNQVPDASSMGTDVIGSLLPSEGLLPGGASGALDSGGGAPKPKHRHYLQCWLRGIGTGCVGSALHCAMTGPGWVVCFAGGCGAVTPLVTSFACLFF